MRIYFSSEVSKVVSSVVLILSLAVFGFAVWKAVDFLGSSPDLKEIQELVNQGKR